MLIPWIFSVGVAAVDKLVRANWYPIVVSLLIAYPIPIAFVLVLRPALVSASANSPAKAKPLAKVYFRDTK